MADNVDLVGFGVTQNLVDFPLQISGASSQAAGPIDIRVIDIEFVFHEKGTNVSEVVHLVVGVIVVDGEQGVGENVESGNTVCQDDGVSF